MIRRPPRSTPFPYPPLFRSSKSPRERAAMETLRRLHPRYEADVMAFVQADPARTARLALDVARLQAQAAHQPVVLDRKSTRLNSSHLVISYAVFCLKKKRPA